MRHVKYTIYHSKSVPPAVALGQPVRALNALVLIQMNQVLELALVVASVGVLVLALAVGCRL